MGSWREPHIPGVVRLRVGLGHHLGLLLRRRASEGLRRLRAGGGAPGRNGGGRRHLATGGAGRDLLFAGALEAVRDGEEGGERLGVDGRGGLPLQHLHRGLRRAGGGALWRQRRRLLAGLAPALLLLRRLASGNGCGHLPLAQRQLREVLLVELVPDERLHLDLLLVVQVVIQLVVGEVGEIVRVASSLRACV